jgi:PIN domain nuclease of toxin-antitoxin system
MTGDRPMGPRASQLLADPGNEVLLSSAAVWEVAIKRASGKLKAPEGFAETVIAYGAIALPITIEHAEAAGGLPAHHRDPFDRMLVALAQMELGVIVSADPALRAYDVRVEW